MIGNKFKYYNPFVIAAYVILIGAVYAQMQDNKEDDMPKWIGYNEVKKVDISLKDGVFTKEALKAELDSLDIKHSDIVYAQAKLETGNFKSNLFLKNNNLFGFRNKNKWLKFDSWQDCCKYYKKWQEKHYKGGDYYKFLINVNYAEDSTYTNKVKKCLN